MDIDKNNIIPPLPGNARRREKDLEKYKIIFDDGNIRMLCALDQTYEEAEEIIGRQLCPEYYEFLKQEEQAAG